MCIDSCVKGYFLKPSNGKCQSISKEQNFYLIGCSTVENCIAVENCTNSSDSYCSLCGFGYVVNNTVIPTFCSGITNEKSLQLSVNKNCTFDSWGAWGTCSSCSGSLKTRTRGLSQNNKALSEYCAASLVNFTACGFPCSM